MSVLEFGYYRSEMDRVDYEISEKFNIIKNKSDID